jgi:hypothetical protein
MYLDDSSSGACGIIIAGLNPGRAIPSEKAFYRRTGGDYASTVWYLVDSASLIPYYKKTESFARNLGFSGPIHWTELAKCELSRTYKAVPTEMVENCVRAHLSKELAALPDWPVLAVGKTAFHTTAVICANRPVFGVPHTTGAWGGAFASLCEQGTDTPTSYTRRQVRNALKKNLAVWLRVRPL